MRAVLAALAACVGCYSPSFRDCDVTCATSEVCPAGFTCARGYCVEAASTTCIGVSDDAGSSEAAVDADLGAPWGMAKLVEMPAGQDDDPTVTSDGLELYFNRMTGNQSDIYRTLRFSPTSPWLDAALVDNLSSSALDATPKISPDGLSMYFTSDRGGSFGDADIWRATRADRNATWIVTHVPSLSSPALEAGAAATSDDTTIVFYSNRTPGQVSDLFISHLVNGTWSAPEALTELNTSSHEESPFLTDDKLTIYFNSNRTGEHQLYMATRPTPVDPFGPPTPITELNTPDHHETDPYVSPDGRHIYFSRLHAATNVARLYEAVR